MKKMKRIGYVSIFFFLMAATLFLLLGNLEAENPSSVKITVFKTELFADQNGSAVQIFNNSSGQEVDIVNNPNSAFGQGDISGGTYKRVKFTVQNSVTYSGPDPCNAGSQITDQTHFINDQVSADAQVALYFATADDGGGTGWYNNGTAGNPLLMQSPIIVESGATTVVRLIFNTADTLVCPGATAELLPPTMSVVNFVEDVQSACSIAGDYWFVHYNISTSPYDQNGNLLQPTVTNIVKKSEAATGWGKLTINADGTWQVVGNEQCPDGTNTCNGMAEHRHRFAEWDTTNTSGEGVLNPVDTNTPTIAGDYEVTGSKIFLFFPEGGFIEGGFSDDCNTFVGVNIEGTEENDLVMAVRKPLSQPSIENKKYFEVSPAFNIHYDPNNGNLTDYFNFEADTMVVESSSDTSIEWGLSYDIRADYAPTGGGEIEGFTILGSSEEAFHNTGLSALIQIEADGLAVVGETFVGFGENGSAVIANDIIAPAPNSSHRISAGFFLNLDSAPLLADLEGDWIMGALDSDLDPGSDVDGDSDEWGDGDEQIIFGITFGEFSVDASGNVSWSFINKDAFSGVVQADSGSGYLEAHEECYAVTTPPTSITDTTCSGGIKVPVFYVRDPNTNEINAKLALDTTKKVVTIWTPVDANGVLEHSDNGCPDITLNCFLASERSTSGIGVKVQ